MTCSGAGARSCVTTVLRAVRDRLAAWAPRRRLTRERAWTSNVPVAGPGGAFVLAWIDDDPPIGRTSTGGALPPTSESVIGRQCWEVRADPTKMGWAISGRPGVVPPAAQPGFAAEMARSAADAHLSRSTRAAPANVNHVLEAGSGRWCRKTY